MLFICSVTYPTDRKIDLDTTQNSVNEKVLAEHVLCTLHSETCLSLMVILVWHHYLAAN